MKHNQITDEKKGALTKLYIVTLFIKLYAEYIMQNAGLDDSQAGIKIAKEISTTSDMEMISF